MGQENMLEPVQCVVGGGGGVYLCVGCVEVAKFHPVVSQEPGFLHSMARPLLIP